MERLYRESRSGSFETFYGQRIIRLFYDHDLPHTIICQLLVLLAQTDAAIRKQYLNGAGGDDNGCSKLLNEDY